MIWHALFGAFVLATIVAVLTLSTIATITQRLAY